MNTKATTAQTKLAAAIAAREQSKNATAELDAAIADLANAGGDLIKQIRAKAAVDGDNVYLLAQIPAPATPTPKGAPGTPLNFKVTLDQDGVITLDWKCANPAGATGTVYQVSRKLGGPDAAGDYAVVGTSGGKR